MTVQTGTTDIHRRDAPSQVVDLLAAVSRRLIRASDAEVEQGIQSVLEMIRVGLELDRVTVWNYRKGKNEFFLLTDWEASELTRPPRSMLPQNLPWLTSRLLAGKTVIFSDLKELPGEAATDKRSLERLGTRSLFSCALRVASETVGALSLGVTRSRRIWSEFPPHLIRLLGDALAGALVRRRSRSEIDVSAQRYRSFVENSTEGIWCMEFGDPLSLDLAEEDLITEIYDRARMVECNDAFARMYGFQSASEMGLWRFKEFLPPDSQTMEVIRAAYHADFKAPDLESVERDRDGNPRIFLNNLDGQVANGKLVRIWGTQRDVTEKRAQQAQTRLQSAAIEAFDFGCIIVDARAEDMPIVYANQGFTKLTGYTREEVLGTNCRFLQGGDTDPQSRAAIGEALARGQRFDSELLNYRKDGTPFWNHMRIAPVRDANGEVTHFVGIQTDVTHRRQREARLTELQAQLAHVTRLNTMGEVSAAVAHEINQPLTAITSNARAARRFLAGSEDVPAEVTEILEDISNDGLRAAAVCQRLRALVSPHGISGSANRLDELILEVVDLLRSDAILRRLDLEVELGDSVPPVWCDAVQLQQVVINLVLNACEAMQDTPTEHRRLVITTAREGAEAARVSVRDSGPGFGETQPQDLFLPFKTTKPDGMGMGLSISQTIIEAHGGRIWGCENPDGGSTFHFTLPLASAGSGESP